VRKGFLGIAVIALAATSCTRSDAPQAWHQDPAVVVQATDSPYMHVTAGSVSALVPSGWHAEPVGLSDPSEGFMASPRPTAWRGAGGTPGPVATGMAATWVDATDVGVPSDFYYLAARGPIIARLLRSKACQAQNVRVFVDREPDFIRGEPGSPGDFVAAADGICRRHGVPSTRWSYFVAAPGYGPTNEVGIPGSGLYMVVAVTHDSPRAGARLMRMLSSVRFGDARIDDFVMALR
jgi:hypothetical protein